MSTRRLPLFPKGEPPTLDEMRSRLGGRSAPGALREAGRIVGVVDEDATRAAVVLGSDEGSVEAWLSDTEVRRIPRAALVPFPGEPDADVVRRTGEATVFARLAEGNAVRFVTPQGDADRGFLREKCRFGAIVERHDGAFVAVGLAALEPADVLTH